MKNINYLTLISICLICFGCNFKNNVDEKKDTSLEQEALESAKQWLLLIDSEKYGQSWEEASEYFKKSITKENWISAVEKARSSFGGKGRNRNSSRSSRKKLRVISYRCSQDHIPGRSRGLLCLRLPFRLGGGLV